MHIDRHGYAALSPWALFWHGLESGSRGRAHQSDQQGVVAQRQRLGIVAVLLCAVAAEGHPVRRPEVHRLRAVESCRRVVLVKL